MLSSSRRKSAVLPALFLVTLWSSALLQAQEPTVPPSEYGKWETFLGSPLLSPDGNWLAFRTRRVDQESRLNVRPLEGGQEEDFQTVKPYGQNAEFSNDSAWLAFRTGLSEEDTKNLSESKKPVRLKAGLLELATGQEKTFQDIESLAFDETGRYLALLGYKPEEPKGAGANLRVVDLASGSETAFGNVSAFSWSDTGSMLAFTLATGADEGNGLQVYDAAQGRLRGLDSSGSDYQGLSWREEGYDLAVLRSQEAASEESSAYQLIAWTGLDGEEPVRRQLDPAQAGIAQDLEVVPHGRPGWSEDGSSISFGLRPKPEEDEEDAEEEENGDQAESGGEPEEGEEKEKPELPGLQIWHTSDIRLFPEQKVSKGRDERRVLLAVWHLDSNRAVQVGTGLMERASILEGWEKALERVSAPYPWGAMFGRPYHDGYLVDLATGERSKVWERVRYGWSSAGGRYLLSYDGEDYWSYDVSTGAKTNLTEDLEAEFVNTRYDTPTDQLPPYGSGGWLEDDAAVLLYDRFDVWRVAPDGSGGTRITRGAEDQVIHRVMDLDRQGGPALDPEWLYLTLRSEKTEQRGFARVPPGADKAERLMLEDKFLWRLTKAEEADVFVYSSESRADSPDYFTAGPDLSDPRQVTRTNPFQDDYAWTRAELFDFKSEAGRDLQAALLYPANHDPSRRYPMIVYTYEILAPQIHIYEPPDQRDYYNFTAWTQQGYFVLMPDIRYRARQPGVSALEAVKPAVASVVDRGLADAARVGLIGHSWGGYQAAYLPTRSNIFAASVAGAPLTDFVSFMGQIHWRPGIAELSHWETGQGRMEVPYWEDPEAHHDNSPIHKVHEMETPLLMAFGDNDGVVDWDQGTEFFNFARRAGKQMVLLVYEGEGHGFSQTANRIDYHRRILEWFGHYLKGQPAPDWITKGIAFKDLEKEKERVANQDQ